MNVLYDISAMGDVYGNSNLKAGIPRVIEELAHQLIDVEECHLALCSGQCILGSLDYVKSDPRFKNVPFAYNKLDAFLQRERKNVQHLVDTASGSARNTARAKRKLLRHLMKFTKASPDALDRSSLRGADIFHSTFAPFPERVKSTQRLQRFLTIYDMIPVLFPEYCGGVDDTMRAILSCIDESTWMLSISEATKTDFCNYLNLNPDRIFVTPLAADTTLFYPNHSTEEQAAVRQKYHIGGGPYVLSLCTIEPRKNIDHVIRCFVTLMQAGQTPDLQLVLAGSKGWDYAHIFKEIEGAEALKNSIIVTGFVQDEDLAALYSGAFVFVYPSLYEGFGLPPLEAMQCGTPVITSNTSSLPEVVGDAGIMLDPKDADGLCQSLLSLHQDSGLRAAMAAKSLARAKEFSWKRCAEDTMNAYRMSLS